MAQPSGGGRIEWLTREAELAELAGAWDALAEHERSPFVRHRWFLAWWREFADDASLETPLLCDGAELLAAFPLARRGRTLTSLAAETAWDYRPLARDEAALDAVLGAALDADADELVVHGLAGDTSAAARLRALAAERGRTVAATVVRRAPYLRTAGSFEEYLSRLDAGFRRETRRRRRKLESEHDVLVDPVGRDPSPELLERALELEASGWKGEDGGAVLASQRLTRFYRSVAEAYGRDGRFRLPRIEADGRLVAMMLALEDGGRVTSLRSAYDESLRAYGLGVLLKLAVAERCFADEIDELDLQGDAAPWKLQFEPELRDYLSVRVYRRSPAGLARLAWRRVGVPAKRRAAELAGRRPRTP